MTRTFRNDGDTAVAIPSLGVGVAPGETVDLDVDGPLANLTEVGADQGAEAAQAAARIAAEEAARAAAEEADRIAAEEKGPA